MSNTKASAGNASVEFDGDMSEFFLSAIKTVLPNAERIMRESLDEIERQAVADWPKKKPTKSYNRKTRQFTVKDESQKSYKKFQRGIRVDPDGSVVLYLKNTADYSWAIKFGEDSRNKDGRPILQPQGKKAARELLFKPLTKASRKVIKALSEDLNRRL